MFWRKKEIVKEYETKKFNVGKCKIIYTSEKGIKETYEVEGYVRQVDEYGYSIHSQYCHGKIEAPHIITAKKVADKHRRDVTYKNTKNSTYTAKEDGTGIYHFYQRIATAEIMDMEDYFIEERVRVI